MPLTSRPQPQVWTLPGGLTLAFERRSGGSFAFDLRLPWGSVHDPHGHEGALGVTEEWRYKGAGGYSARALQDAFDDLGVRRGGGVSLEATRLSISGLREDLAPALALAADVRRRAHFDAAELPVLRDLARQDLAALSDSPGDLLSLRSRQVLFPPQPGDAGAGFAHAISGTRAGLQRMDAESLRQHAARQGQRGAVLGIVADAEADWVYQEVERLFGDWHAGEVLTVPTHFQAGRREHVPFAAGEQTHLSLVALGPHPRDPDWLAWQVALSALSGGSASRLFTRVREERGLAYEVSASSMLLGGQGFLTAYAGSTPERASETLEVLLAELQAWSEGLTPDEFRRARTALETGVVFRAEGLRSRAGSLTRDLAVLGRVRTPAERRAALAALTPEQVDDFLARYRPLDSLSVVSLGPRPLSGSLAVGA